jgi:hypothetical protein
MRPKHQVPAPATASPSPSRMIWPLQKITQARAIEACYAEHVGPPNNLLCPVYLHLDARDFAVWLKDISECPACRSLYGDEVCNRHDLTSDKTLARYLGR